jgi:hypothetical protein
VLLLDDPKHRDRCCTRSCAAAERVEVVGVSNERVHELRRAADGGHGVPVAHRLAQGHEISGLHLVGDVQPARGMHEGCRLAGPVVTRPADAVAGEHPVDEHPSPAASRLSIAAATGAAEAGGGSANRMWGGGGCSPQLSGENASFASVTPW